MTTRGPGRHDSGEEGRGDIDNLFAGAELHFLNAACAMMNGV